MAAATAAASPKVGLSPCVRSPASMQLDVISPRPRSLAQGGFLPFLPQDNASLADPAAEELFGITASELGNLLKLPAGGFWAVVQTDPSLGAYIDSYLRFKRCASSTAAWAGEETGQELPAACAHAQHAWDLGSAALSLCPLQAPA